MPRRYRIERPIDPFDPLSERRALVECTADEFADANDADTVLEVYALMLGQSVTVGGDYAEWRLTGWTANKGHPHA